MHFILLSISILFGEIKSERNSFNLIPIESEVLKCKRNIHDKLDKLACLSSMNLLNEMKYLVNDEYKPIYNSDGKQIFYFLNNNIYHCNCITLNKYYFLDTIDKCTRHIKIKFLENSVLKDGFFTPEEIIREDSPEIECLKVRVIFYNER